MKEFDGVDQSALWKVPQVYGVHDRLVVAFKSVHVDSKSCVRVGRGESDISLYRWRYDKDV